MANFLVAIWIFIVGNGEEGKKRETGWDWPPSLHQVACWIILVIYAVLMGIVMTMVHPLIGPLISCILIGWIAVWLVLVTVVDPAVPGGPDRDQTPERLQGREVEAHVENEECTMCRVKVDVTVKHCTKCNNCVAGHVEHNEWLNTCLGRAHNRSFVTLVTSVFIISGLLCLFLFALPMYSAVVLCLYFVQKPTEEELNKTAQFVMPLQPSFHVMCCVMIVANVGIAQVFYCVRRRHVKILKDEKAAYIAMKLAVKKRTERKRAISRANLSIEKCESTQIFWRKRSRSAPVEMSVVASTEIPHEVVVDNVPVYTTRSVRGGRKYMWNTQTKPSSSPYHSIINDPRGPTDSIHEAPSKSHRKMYDGRTDGDLETPTKSGDGSFSVDVSTIH